ncbi:hypothetical protein D1BOALGB6SA_651 [Olavius sp. associated proteobacterium Delta 1]|nr:hypothetical protein D1BOALGB6SA_651 [Olavius sp. associated proteobacterium Delta 1]
MAQQKFDLPEADPFSTLDEEIARLNAFFTSLSPAQWGASTRCEGWTVRDMVAHFDSDEAYNEACLDNTLEALAAGFSSIAEFNQRQVQNRAHLSTEKVLKQWRTRQAMVRKKWEALGLNTKIKTIVGPYPLRAQIWHITSEYATHADDMGVKVPPKAQQPRLMWSFQLSAFAVQEKKDPPGLERRGNRMIITLKQHNLSLSMEDFVAAVSARLTLPQNQEDRQIIKALRALA